MRIVRRRPLLRAAAIGGRAYQSRLPQPASEPHQCCHDAAALAVTGGRISRNWNRERNP